MGRNLFANEKPIENKRKGRNLFANELTDESFLSKLPRNIASGFAQGSHELLNTPHDVAKNIEQQGQQFGSVINKQFPLEKYGVNQPQNNFSLANQIPYQQDYNFAQMLGQKGEPTFADTAIQKGAQYLPELLFGANALRNVLPHLTRRGAGRTLNQARQLGIERNIGSLNVNPELIEDMRQFLPNTVPYRNAMDAAHSGDYQALFNLQSDVGRNSANLARSWTSAAERAHGRTGLQSQNALLDEIHRALQEGGHHDISDLLRRGREEYRRFARFRPYRNAIATAGIGTLGAYALPKNALTNLIYKLATLNH